MRDQYADPYPDQEPSMGKEAFNRSERRATGAQKDCTSKNERTQQSCERRAEHTGQHKAKTRGGHVYWS